MMIVSIVCDMFYIYKVYHQCEHADVVQRPYSV